MGIVNGGMGTTSTVCVVHCPIDKQKSMSMGLKVNANFKRNAITATRYENANSHSAIDNFPHTPLRAA
jgi:hypothetical protein